MLPLLFRMILYYGGFDYYLAEIYIFVFELSSLLEDKRYSALRIEIVCVVRLNGES